MPNITMTYGSGASQYSFSPVPLMNITKQYQKTADSTFLGTTFNVQLDGTLYAPSGGISNIVQMQDALRTAFSQDGRRFEVLCDGSTLFFTHPRINNLEFPASTNNWVTTCKYVINLEFDDEPQPTGLFSVSLGEDSTLMPPYIADFKENWAVQVLEDKSYYSFVLPGAINDAPAYHLQLSHNISAIGKRHYSDSGLDKQAWQQAQSYVVARLGYSSGFVGASGVLNINAANFAPFNHIRSSTIDADAGSFAVQETWIVINPSGTGVAGNAIEDFVVETRKGLNTDMTTVSIQGSIQGLENRDYGTTPISGYTINTTKYAAASGYWNNIKDTNKLLPRVQMFGAAAGANRSINIVPLSRVVGHNPVNGIITYNYEYDDRPSNCVAGSLTESIVINDINATDIFAEIPVLGRARGPVLQDMATVTSTKRNVSIDVIMAPGTGCTVAGLFVNNPRTAVRSIFTLFYDNLAASSTQVFTYIDNETWEPKFGRYQAEMGWVYQSGC